MPASRNAVRHQSLLLTDPSYESCLNGCHTAPISVRVLLYCCLQIQDVVGRELPQVPIKVPFDARVHGVVVQKNALDAPDAACTPPSPFLILERIFSCRSARNRFHCTPSRRDQSPDSWMASRANESWRSIVPSTAAYRSVEICSPPQPRPGPPASRLRAKSARCCKFVQVEIF